MRALPIRKPPRRSHRRNIQAEGTDVIAAPKRKHATASGASDSGAPSCSAVSAHLNDKTPSGTRLVRSSTQINKKELQLPVGPWTGGGRLCEHMSTLYVPECTSIFNRGSEHLHGVYQLCRNIEILERFCVLAFQESEPQDLHSWALGAGGVEVWRAKRSRGSRQLDQASLPSSARSTEGFAGV